MNSVTLVLLQGLLNDARLWSRQIAGLSGRAAAFVPDLTGADSIAALAAGVLRQAPGGSFALAGLSMGGYVALEIIRQAPERVAALALLDTSARPDAPEATEARRRLLHLAETDFPAVTETLLPRLLHPSRRNDRAVADVVRDMARRVGKEAFLRQERAIMGRADSRPLLPAIACPTLVACGREDAITPAEVHEEMAGRIPGADLAVIDACGHLSPLERPDEVTELLRRWLKRL
ncbi:MAG: alpha/beta fold hydrolase [bacterium]